MHVVKLDFIPLQFLLLKAENLLYFLSHFRLIGLSLDMCLHHIVHLLWLALLIANLNPFFKYLRNRRLWIKFNRHKA